MIGGPRGRQSYNCKALVRAGKARNQDPAVALHRNAISFVIDADRRGYLASAAEGRVQVTRRGESIASGGQNHEQNVNSSFHKWS